MNETKELSIFKGNGNNPKIKEDEHPNNQKNIENLFKKDSSISQGIANTPPFSDTSIRAVIEEPIRKNQIEIMLEELMATHDFISINHQELYIYQKDQGYWKLIIPNTVDSEFRSLLRGWIGSVNSANIIELYKWLLIEAPSESPEIFNKGKKYLNFQDCAYNWRQDEKVKKRKHLYFTYVLNTQYPKEKSNGTFRKFIDDAIGDDKDTQKELAKFVGLCLSDIRDLKYAFFLYGASNTGKTTLINAIKNVIGESQCSSLSFSQLSNEFAISYLYGRRLNASAEISGVSTTKLDVLKSLSGNDAVMGSYKYKDSFQFNNRCLLVFACNVMPKVDYMELQSFASRMIIFPFKHVVDRDDWNKNFNHRLQEDIRGIIDFAIKGLRHLHDDNYQIKETAVMEECKNDYAALYDSFSVFCDKRLKASPKESITSADIEKHYSQFCENYGYDVLKPNQWSQILKRRFNCKSIFISVETDSDKPKRLRGYKGVALKDKAVKLFKNNVPENNDFYEQLQEIMEYKTEGENI